MSEKIVPAHGPKDCDIALVAEAPGASEETHGIPMVGESGKLMCNDIFARSGIHRTITETYVPGQGTKVDVESSVFVTNIINYFPGKDVKFEKRFYEDASCKRPTVELIRNWDRVATELSGTSAKVILAAGNHSLKALTHRWGVANWRGSILECTLLPGRKVIPIIHPAAILREWYYRQLTILDCKRAKAQSAFAEIRRPHREYVIRPTIDQIIACEEALCSAEYISFDIETKGNNIACIGFAPTPQWGICVPFISAMGHYWAHAEDERRAWQFVHRVLTASSKKIAQNCLFDLSHLAAHGIHVANMWFDTMLAQNVLLPEIEKSLAVLCSIYTEEPYYKAEGRKALKAKGDVGEKAWDWRQADEVLWRYNLKDCMVACEVAIEQHKDLLETSSPGQDFRRAA